MSNPCTPQSLEDLQRPVCIPNPEAPAVDWPAKGDWSPFINPRNCRYSIVVDKAYANARNPSRNAVRQYDSLGEMQNNGQTLQDYFAFGVDSLVEFYRKDLSKSDVTRQQLINAVATQGKRWNQAGDPTEKMKVLVALPYGLFHNLPERRYVPNYKLEEKLTVTFDVRTLKKKIDYVRKAINKYKSPSGIDFGIGTYGSREGGLKGLNFNQEYRNIGYFLNYLQLFLDYNQINIDLGSADTTRQESITFVVDPPAYQITGRQFGQLKQQKEDLEERIEEGYDVNSLSQKASRWVDVAFDPTAPDTVTEARRSDERSAKAREAADKAALKATKNSIADIEASFPQGYKLLDALYSFEDGSSKYLKVAWPTYGGTELWDRNRTIALIYWMNDLFDIFNNNISMSMISFVDAYIYPPLDTSPDSTRPEWAEDIMSGIDTAIGIGEDIMGYVDYASDIFGGEQSLMPLIDSHIKTWAELQLENDEILSTAFQANTINNTEQVFRFDDSGILNQARFLEGISTNLDALYEHVLNHVDIRYIILKLLTCLGLDPLTMDAWLLELLLALAELLLWLADMDLATFDFDINWALIWRDITEALINYVLNLLIDLVNAIITFLVMMLLAELDKLCQEELDHGSVDLSGLISDNFDSAQDAAAFYGSLAGNLGAPDGIDAGALLRELIRDLSTVLTTRQICSLIRGEAATGTLTIVHNFILLDKYSPFHSKFDTLESVSTLFSGLGRIIDPSFCEIQNLIPDDAGELCKSQAARREEIKRNLLSRKKDMSSEDIEEQIEAEKQRRNDLVNEMISLLSAEGGLGAAFTEKLNEGLANSDIMDRVTDHPAARDAISQMKSAVYDNTATTLVTDGLGTLETPYFMIQYEKEIRVPLPGPEDNFALVKMPWPQAFSFNRGIMHIISDKDEYNFYRYGLTSQVLPPIDEIDLLAGIDAIEFDVTNDKLGDGLVDHLNWINLNEATIPDVSKPYNRTTIRATDSSWTYRTKVYPRIGFWSSTLFEGDRSYNTYSVAYDSESHGDAVDQYQIADISLDSPKINTFFIGRDPFVGIPPYGFSENGVPLAMASRGGQLKAFPEVFEGEPSLSPDREVVRTSHNQFLKKYDATPIDVFIDMPKVYHDGLVPEYNEFILFKKGAVGSKQQATYMNLVANKLQGFNDDHDPEGHLAFGGGQPRLVEEIVDSYQCVFSDVMRILYRFVTDSEFHDEEGVVNVSNPTYALWEETFPNSPRPRSILPTTPVPKTKHMLDELRKMFNDPQKFSDLAGVTDDMEDTIQQNMASSLSNRTTSSEATNSIIGEPLLRYMIRMYILEIYLKNMYMLVSRPERRNPLGRTVSFPTFDEEDEPESVTLNISNPIHHSRTLDLKDTVDSIMVSYITEYIGYSNSRVSGCDSFYDVAHKIVSKEWEETKDEEGNRETLSVTGSDDNILAHYPATDSSFTTTSQRRGKKAALKYFVAKELNSFVESFQSFVELKNLIPDFSKDTEKRSLMESFLDKFEILGYNIPSPPLEERDQPGFTSNILRDLDWTRWLNNGEGLYMQFYSRGRGNLNSRVVLFDQQDSYSDDTLIGLRVCLRDSFYHPTMGPDHVSGDKFEKFADLYYNFAGRDRNPWPKLTETHFAWQRQLGIPVSGYEARWGDIKQETGLTSNNPTGPLQKRKILDYLKSELVKTNDFRVMFEYVFPVKKLFNFMFIQMDQNVSAFLVNTKTRGYLLNGPLNSDSTDVDDDGVPLTPGEDFEQLKRLGVERGGVLGVSNIDPEQFVQAKGVVKSILENVNNSDNYRYINAEIEEAGGQGKLALMKQMQQMMKK